ncbi:hypothetical protein FCN77_11180 [Arthrobacter sp. 24S4-2]|uniref:DUF6278 family protein n=1 Tax=Arthrobacter sp. 24S4-2 TaxID=2575374 RepID=UPI0010C7E195|nr:DUF6278 family protein [Arthrobacter sp. 24S4-2]QCO98159.1 hypothetical protein FCN77_11180 [Arthrobacter sp. 24S4-2]
MSGEPADFSRHNPGTGTPRDYAIFFTREPAANAAAVEKELDAHLGQCSSLRQWTAARGATLADVASGVEVLEGLLTGPDRNGPAPWRLRVETGLFIGTVLVRNLPVARWRLLPNGYPVVHLAENTDLDVIALARTRLETGAPDLRTVLPYAESLTPAP